MCEVGAQKVTCPNLQAWVTARGGEGRHERGEGPMTGVDGHMTGGGGSHDRGWRVT